MSWAESLPFDVVVFQSGSTHVRLTPRTRGESVRQTVGSMMPADDTLSIRIDAYTGTNWTLQIREDGTRDRGVHAFEKAHLSDTPKNILIPQTAGSDYHAIVVLDKVTASPPAVGSFGSEK